MRAFAVVVILAGTARADPPAPPAPPAPIDLAAARDAASDRGFALSTALVVPAGDIELSARLVTPIGILGGITMGVGGGFELSVDGGGIVLGDTAVGTYAVGGKLAIARGPSWQVAVTGTARHYSDQYDDGGDRGTLASGELLITGCLDAACTTLATAGAGAVYAGDQTVPAASAGLVAGGGTTKLVLEAAGTPGGVAGFAGLRFGGSHFACDIGAAVAASTIIPLPLVGISARL